MSSSGGKRELLLTEKYEPLAFGGRNAPYLDRISVSQSSSKQASSAKWKKLLIQPISIPNLGHTGIKTAFSAQEEVLMRPDGSVGKGLRNLIQSTMRDFRRLEEEDPEYEDDGDEDGGEGNYALEDEDYYDDDEIDYDGGERDDEEHVAKLQARLGNNTKQLFFDSGMRRKAKGIREEKEAEFEERQAEEAAAAAAAATAAAAAAAASVNLEERVEGEEDTKTKKAGTKTVKKTKKKKKKKKRLKA